MCSQLQCVSSLKTLLQQYVLTGCASSLCRTILSLAATNTAVMCSHALPAIGRTIRPRKDWLMP
jgi:hypothetical protein